MSPSFDEASFLSKFAENSEADALRKLMVGRVDYYAGDKNVALNLIASHRKLAKANGDIIQVEPLLSKGKLFIGFSKKAAGNAELKAAFEKGWEIISKNGELERINAEHKL